MEGTSESSAQDVQGFSATFQKKYYLSEVYAVNWKIN
jgi:hypothetical protein